MPAHGRSSFERQFGSDDKSTGFRRRQQLAHNAKLRAQAVRQEPEPREPEPPTQATPPVECEASCAHHRPVRLSWAKLIKRVFKIDVEHCPTGGGSLKIIAAIREQPVIEKILTNLGLPARAPARGSQFQAA